VAKTSAPPSNGQSVRNDTTYTYYDDGQVHTSTDPWSIATTYDYNELGQQTARTLTSAGGSSSRTMGWSFYPDGSLASRTDDGVPVGLQVALADNSDTQSTSATGSWATASTGDPATEQGYDYRTHAAGAGTDAFTWNLDVPQDGTYTVYAKYPQVTGAATSATYTVTHGTTNNATTVSQATDANTWVSLGAYAFTQGGPASVSLAQSSTGTVVADAVKLVRSNAGETDNEKHAFTYAYDPNGNLTSIADSSPSAAVDTYGIDYTGLDQVAKVTESASGTEKTHTAYTYDTDGKPKTVDHPGQYSSYIYDLRELVQQVKVGTSATDTSPKTTSYTYTPRGQQLRQTKANGNTLDTTYWPSGEVRTQSEKTSGGTLVDSHTLTWDPDGNKAEDVASKQNADNHSAYLNSTTDYTYDPVDRLAQSVKTGNGATTETYVHDNNANVISQTVQGSATTYTYDRNRLLSSASGGATAAYTYDPYGRLQTVTSAGTVIEHNTYDGFDHVTQNTKLGLNGAAATTSYTYDPLDRTATETTGGKTTDYSYLGLTDQVLDETVAGQLTKSYQYSPWGQRLSQIAHSTDGTSTDGFYGYNSHTDVETVTDDSGQTTATYGYTAYGANDTSEFTGIDKPDAVDPTKQPYNAYRFNAKRWDATSGTYDMGFRDYDPGLNTFTTRDMYNGALDDMNLAADPLTGSRYAFGGGNPTTNIELDGHMLCDGAGHCGSVGYLDRVNAEPSAPADDSSGSGTSGSGTSKYVGPPSCGFDCRGWAVPFFQPYSDKWTAPAEQYGQEAGVDPSLLLAIAMKETSGKMERMGGEGFPYQLYQQLSIAGTDAGAWPHGGSSLGVTNIKPETFDTVKKNFPDQFQGVEWANLAGNDSLDVKATAYYVKYLQRTYVQTASPELRRKYTDNEIIEGIYNTGESAFRSGASVNGTFGPLGTDYINSTDGYVDQARAMLDYTFGFGTTS
jgi:RHS repeat-associated protein